MSETFKRVLHGIKENKQNRLSGNPNCIPWSLKRFSSVIPGIQQGRYYLVSANQKVGKTQLADFLFLYEPYFYLKQNKSNIKLKIFYFSLEMRKEEKIKSVISHKLYRDTKSIVSPEKMDSLFEGYILEDSVEKQIEEYEEFFKDFESIITFVDEIRNPFGIYKYIRDYANSHGKYISKDGKNIPHEYIDSGNLEVIKTLDRYQPDDPNEYVVIITDHLSLLQPESGKSLHEAMSTYSSNYCIKMRNRWNYIPVNIQQQAAMTEQQQYTYKGESIEDKLMPSASGLGDCKLTSRDVDIMLGLFAPHRYSINQWEGYDITKLGDNFRELSIILNRRGTGFISVPLYFNGAVNQFAELPKPGDMSDDIYRKILEKKI
tara:strand:+ start:2447 stop:3571 length:1125 start_codon:yes stop_codon:yes gene_type:complete